MSANTNDTLEKIMHPQYIKDVLALADYMDGLNAPMFDMRVVRHPCGTPACALGHGFAWNLELTSRVSRCLRTTDAGKWGELFGGHLFQTIHTPQQWAAHARQWVREQGYEVESKQTFQSFLDATLKPVNLEETHDQTRPSQAVFRP